jgi:NifU-like protein involved in Fe-S cluster formation
MASPDAVGHASLDGRAPRVTVHLRIRDEIVEQLMFQAFGCGVTIASCSVLTELATGRRIAECAAITPAQVIAALSGMPDDKRFCADLAIQALRDALETWAESRSQK